LASNATRNARARETDKVFTVRSVIGPGRDFTAMSLIARLKRTHHGDKNVIHGLKRRALASWTLASRLDRRWPREMLGTRRKKLGIEREWLQLQIGNVRTPQKFRGYKLIA